MKSTTQKISSGTIGIEVAANQDVYLTVRFTPGHYTHVQLSNAIRRTIPGCRWVTALKAFAVPLGKPSEISTPPSPFLLDGIKELMRKWGFSLRGEGLPRLLASWERAGKGFGITPRSIDGKLSIPGITGTLSPPQVDGVVFLVEKKRALLGDDVGSGKSVTAFAALTLLDAFPAITVATQTMKLALSEELGKWFPERTTVVLSSRPKPAKLRSVVEWWLETQKQNPHWRKLATFPRGAGMLALRQTFDADLVNGFTPEKHKPHLPVAMASLFAADMVLLNYDILAAWLPMLKMLGVRGLIVDESHRVRGLAAARTKALIALSQEIPVRFLLSGTPVVNRPLELLPQIRIMGLEKAIGGSQYFLERYCKGAKTKFGQRWDGKHHLDELRTKLTKLCFLNRPRKVFRPDAADPVIQQLPVLISNITEYLDAERDIARWFVDHVCAGDTESWLREQERKYPVEARQFAHLSEEDRFARALDHFLGLAENRVQRTEALQRLIHLRTITGLGKVSAAEDFVASFTETERKLVVFAVHKEVQRDLAKALAKYRPLTLFAEHSSDVRNAAVREFQQNPDRKLFVASLGAGGEGITLHAASDVLFVELDWTPAAMRQGLGRIDRIGQLEPCNAYWLTGQLDRGNGPEMSIDARLLDLLDEKNTVVSAVMGEAAPVMSEVRGMFGHLAVDVIMRR